MDRQCKFAIGVCVLLVKHYSIHLRNYTRYGLKGWGRQCPPPRVLFVTEKIQRLNRLIWHVQQPTTILTNLLGRSDQIEIDNLVVNLLASASRQQLHCHHGRSALLYLTRRRLPMGEPEPRLPHHHWCGGRNLRFRSWCGALHSHQPLRSFAYRSCLPGRWRH